MGVLGPAANKLEQSIARAKDSRAISRSAARSAARTVGCPECRKRYEEQLLLSHLESSHRDTYWRLFSEAKDAGLNPFEGPSLLQYIEGRKRKAARSRSPQEKRRDA
jgi:hypothetical protein